MTYSLLLWILTLKKVFKQRSHLWHGIIMDADFIHVADFPDHEERLSGVLGKCFWMAACLKKKIHRALLSTYNLLVRTRHTWKGIFCCGIYDKKHILLRDLSEKAH